MSNFEQRHEDVTLTDSQKRTALVDFIWAQTQRSMKHAPLGAELNTAKLKGEYSEKAIQVSRDIDESDFGCRTGDVRKLMSTMLGEALPLEDEASSDEEEKDRISTTAWIPYSGMIDEDGRVFIPMYHDNDDELAYTACKGGIDIMNNDDTDSWIKRYATKKEIEDLLKNNPDALKAIEENIGYIAYHYDLK